MKRLNNPIRLKNPPGRIHVVREPEMSLIHGMVPKEIRSLLNIELYKPARVSCNLWHLQEHLVLDLSLFKAQMEPDEIKELSWQFPAIWIDLHEDAQSLQIQIWIAKSSFARIKEACGCIQYRDGWLSLKNKENRPLFSMKKIKPEKLPDHDSNDQGVEENQ